MKRMLKVSLGVLAVITLLGSANAQTPDPAPPMNAPDKVSWDLFVMVNKKVPGINNSVLWETWANNEDTFQQNPKFPGASAPPNCVPGPLAALAVAALQQPPVTPVASPKILNVPALERLAPTRLGPQPQVAPVPPGRTVSEETRRNRATFDFIFCNKLFTKAGLRVAFATGQPLSFPIESVEVKANWVSADGLSPADYHINTASDGKNYALVAMHIISKMVPNWTWATFEHKDNKGRCDFVGCRDKFGAVVQDVPPLPAPGGRYNPCVKSPALKKLFADNGLPSLWDNYCLKGSQVDFVTPTGIKTVLGNSVTEGPFADTSSCLTCHARASVAAQGNNLYGGGFVFPPQCPTGQTFCSPNGSPDPAWFWNNVGQPNQSMLTMQTDFVWSIPLNAIGP